jgi:predicted Zn-dependent protease
LNPFDVDNNGYVELPPADNPNAENTANQHDDRGRPYTKARVLQHTITHEIIHVLGRSGKHSTNEACVMNESSLNWKRDDYLSDEYRPLLSIHNKKR